MMRVLFVDDEQRVLEGLQRMLRPMRLHWEMTFVDSGEAALEAFAVHPFDVIVTDMRMPEMNGASLLSTIHERWPDSIRIALSGHTDEEMAMRTVLSAHQFVSKPCDPRALKEVIDRATSLRDRLCHEGVRRLVGEVGALPVLPSTHRELLAAVERSDVTSSEIATIVERDLALVGNVLKIVNSAFFGLPRRVARIEDAITLIGVSTLRMLALQADLFRPDSTTHSVPGFSLESLQIHSLLTARMARQLVADQEEREIAVAAGLLHDVGTLVLLRSRPDLLAHAMEISRSTARPLHDIEEELWGGSHADIGAYLLSIWGLPGGVIEAVAFHHHPSRTKVARFDAVGAVHVAAVLTSAGTPESQTVGAPTDLLDLAYLGLTGVAERLPRWRALAEEILNLGKAPS